MSIRTDMALEQASRLYGASPIKGISQSVYRDDRSMLEITKIVVRTKQASEKLGKPIGKYITIKSMTGAFDEFSDYFEQRVEVIAENIRELAGKSEKILVTGLGNRNITPDAVGPLCADKIFATRHIKKYSNEIDCGELSEISAISTGVMGQTGIESAEQIKANADYLSPDLVIAVDALACADVENLGKTIQMTDTGISPGSGVENSRKEISQSTLNTKCIAIGIPTVIDFGTIAENLFSSAMPLDCKNMMVTPRNIDALVSNGAKYTAYAINRAFHRNISIEDIESLIM